jgi:phosphoribosylpyrophosphate synthetase
MNNIVLDVDGHRCVATVLYHRNGEFKINLPREKLHDFCIHLSKSIEIYFYFNMKWSEIILSHIANELKAVGFSNVKLVCPYLPFGRANKPEKEYGCRKDILSTFFEMLKAAGIDEVCTSDFHLNIKSNVFCGIKFRNIEFSELWQEEITKISRIHSNDKFLVFAPDSGAVDRAWQTWTVLSYNLPSNPLYCKHMVFTKRRTKDGLQLYGLNEYASNPFYQNRICIIVDDMIDSGKTMMAAIEKVQEFKPKKIYVLVTHLLNNEFKAPADVELMWKFDNVQEA